jgi:hypothetical protein
MNVDSDDDLSNRPASHQVHLDVALILAGEWRRVRRRASLVVALFVPFLAVVIAGSFPLIARRGVTSAGLVLADAALGGLLGAVFVCVPRLAALAHDRHPRDEQSYYGWDELLILVVMPLLILGTAAGLVAVCLVAGVANRDEYNAQTVYVLAVVSSTLVSRSMRPIDGRPPGTRVRQ